MAVSHRVNMSSVPLISVALPAYNAEGYVGDAVQSVLRQSFADWELVIVNDGSTDRTLDRVRAFDDPRIICIDSDHQGPTVAYNRAIDACSGKYLAILNSDDVCYPDRLDRQLREYQSGTRRILFSEVDFIDDQGRPFEGPHFLTGVFERKQQTRAQILERFFTRGNFLCTPTMFTEREVFMQAGRFDPSIFQIQDFDMWIRLVKKYEFFIMPGAVTQYRIHDGNLTGPGRSGGDPAGGARTINEVHLIMTKFFDDVSPALFREAFDRLLIRPGCSSEVERRCEQAFLYLRSSSALNRLIGMERLGQLLRNPESEAVLGKHYDYGPLSLANATSSVDVSNLFRDSISSLFVDTGEGFSERQRVSALGHMTERGFSLTFDIPKFDSVHALRWHPMHGHWCRVRLTEVSYRNSGPAPVTLDPSRLQSNGIQQADGAVLFETRDPVFFIPIEGDIKAVTVKGEWERIEARG